MAGLEMFSYKLGIFPTRVLKNGHIGRFSRGMIAIGLSGVKLAYRPSGPPESPYHASLADRGASIHLLRHQAGVNG